MSGKYTVGVVVGGLAALTPFLYPAMLAVGAWSLYVHGVEPAGDSASAGVMWVAGWTLILTVALSAVVALALGLWGAPRATLTAAGTLLVLAGVRRHMHQRGETNGSV
mgnify:CR=1 FL=1